jgi:dTDP-glucose 4,6-dehydratase
MPNNMLQEDITVTANMLSPQWKSLDGCRVLLTGGTGFFGKWLLHTFLEIRELSKAEMSLTVLSRNPDQFLALYPVFAERKGLDFITGDVRSFTLSARQTFDIVIHGATAADSKLNLETPDEMYSVITDGTLHILDIMRRFPAKRLLYISSGAVYGPQPPSLSHIPETYAAPPPASAYGKGKKRSEQLCLEASANRFDCVIARPFAFVGPYLPLDTHFAIGNFIRDCLEDRPIVIQGDGTPLRSYLYAADLAEWLWTILLRGEHARAYNVGSSDAISILDLAHRVRECAGTKNEIIVHGKKQEGAIPARYVPCIDRAKMELALCQRTSLSDAIQRTIGWHRTGETTKSCK